MLDQMRGFASGFFAKLLMLFLVVSFGIWGIGDILRTPASGDVATVGGQRITVSQFAAAKARMASILGPQASSNPMLDGMVLRQLVQRKLLAGMFEDSQLAVGDEALASLLAQEKSLQSPAGTFDPARYRALLAAEHVSEPVFLAQLRENVASRFISDSLAPEDLQPPPGVAALNNAAAHLARDAWLLRITPAASAGANPGEDAIAQYYDSHKSTDFLAPESRDGFVVRFGEAALSHWVDQEVKAAAAQPGQATPTPQALADLRARTQERALIELRNRIEDALAGGGNFTDALARSGLSASAQPLTHITASTARDPAAQSLMNLAQGEVSPINRDAGGGYHFVYLSAVHAASPRPLPEVRSDVIRALRAEARAADTQARSDALRAALLKAQGKPEALQASADAAKATLTALRRVPKPGEGTPEGLPPTLQEAIFSHKTGEIAGPLSLADGTVLLAVVGPATLDARAKLASATSAMPPARLNALRAQLRDEMMSAALTQAAASHPVRVNGPGAGPAPDAP